MLERKGQTNRTVRFSLLKELMWCGHCGTPMGAKIQPSQNKHYYYCPRPERAYTKTILSSDWLEKDRVTANKTKEDNRWKRGPHCKMTKSLNINVTNDTVWSAVTEIANKSHTLKEQIKTQLMSGKKQSDEQIKSEIRNLQKMKRR